MDLDLIPAHVAALTYYITGGKLSKRRNERGQVSLETAVIAAVVLAVVIALGLLITAAVQNHSKSIK